MRADRLAPLGALLLAAAVLVGLLHWPALRWSARALPLYWSGRFPPLEERRLAAHAGEVLATGNDLERAAALVAEARRIDPNHFGALEGWIAFRAGDHEAAERAYREALAADPTLARAYVGLAEVLVARGDGARAREVVSRGIRTLAAEAARHVPRPDPSVPEAYNRRAREVAQRYERSLDVLRDALRGLVAGSGEAVGGGS